ncbi:GNAT family N-acetyltransferase [Paractinoplanes ferrugineus]|uniref:N-acetyltransferase n=1 Tax=Paractinoplanes ferrugineus TaxID=113564 RepID=A0A919J9Q7_9ACTN|nr:GNAT family N-acetyltransferase [Actinoplanes ferrugineus]GIE15862.1 N-acetyltransferase [Actinoplanes ferrugineus]
MSFPPRRLGADDWRTWRDMRLAALADTPDAFASTLAKEAGYTEADWRAWLAAPLGLKLLAGDDAGMIGAWAPDGTVELYSMWVRPQWRGRGVGDLLIGEVLRWAGTRPVELWVAEGNVVAERLYLRHGFRLTDRRQPHPGRSGVRERLMVRECGGNPGLPTRPDND